MNEPTQSSAPSFGYGADPPKRVLWKWSLALTAAVSVYMMWQCGSALDLASEMADQAVQRFHRQLNSGEFEEICRQRDEAFSQGQKQDELLHSLDQVHRKLGNARAERRVSLHAGVGISGTFVSAQFTTQFEQTPAIETFTWRKGWNTLKLYGYNVQSDAFLKQP